MKDARRSSASAAKENEVMTLPTNIEPNRTKNLYFIFCTELFGMSNSLGQTKDAKFNCCMIASKYILTATKPETNAYF